MEEIIKLVAQKTGMSESIAKIAVDVVLNQLKDRLPDSIGDQLEGLLDNKGGSGSMGDLGGLMGNLGGMFGKK